MKRLVVVQLWLDGTVSLRRNEEDRIAPELWEHVQERGTPPKEGT